VTAEPLCIQGIVIDEVLDVDQPIQFIPPWANTYLVEQNLPRYGVGTANRMCVPCDVRWDSRWRKTCWSCGKRMALVADSADPVMPGAWNAWVRAMRPTRTA
jgi:hypothetical protein